MLADMIPSLSELLGLAATERLALGRELAQTLGSAWTASASLVGERGMIELVHASGHPFVVVGATHFVRGLRADERDGLVTAMMGPHDPDDDETDLEAERRVTARQIPRAVLAAEPVQVPGFLIGREPLPYVRARAMVPGTSLDDLGYPEALGGADAWSAFLAALPDGLTLCSEEQWELVARDGGGGSWIVPVPPNGFPKLWPPVEIFSLENALGVRSLAVAEIFANGYRRGVGDGRGNWGGSTGNAELHAAVRWPDGYGGSRLARPLA